MLFDILIFFLIFIFTFFNSYAQTLPEIIIQDSTQTPGWNIVNIDVQTYKTRSSLANILEDETGWTLKSYGGAGLVTASARGSSAQQVVVQWNGLSLQNPMNGTADFQLFPILSNTKLSVQNGGNTWLGSGSMGGVVHFQSSTPDTGLHANIQLNYGSWNRIQPSGYLSFRKNKWAFQQSIQYLTAKNNFPYYNLFSKQNETLTHAEINQKLSLSELYYIGNQDTITIKAWLQQTYRNLAPTFSQIISQAKQLDNSYRFLGSWAYRRKLWKGNLTVGYLNDFLLYSDSLANLDEKYYSNQYILKHNLSKLIGNHIIIENKMELNLTQAQAERYIKNPAQREILSYGFRVKGFYPRVQWHIGVKQDLVFPEKFTPIMPFAGVEWQLSKKIFWRFNGSRTYRIPTFNDWFWVPGGNPNLRPEDGWNVETAFSGKITNLFNWQITHFQQFVSQWIIWQPTGSFFSPQNIAKVWSKGIESKLNFHYTLQKWQFHSQIQYQFCQVSKIQSDILNDNTVGKQMIYVPVHKGSMMSEIAWKNLSFRYSSQFSSFRWTNPENTQYLNGYWIHSLALSYQMKIKKSLLTAILECRNIGNQVYQVYENRPMPKREFAVTVGCSL